MTITALDRVVLGRTMRDWAEISRAACCGHPTAIELLWWFKFCNVWRAIAFAAEDYSG